MTIIEKIRAEVERLMKENSSSSGLEGGVLDLTYEDGINTALNDVLEILDTLQEQPVDLDNKTIMEEIRKLGCYPNEFDVARRFYELGRQSKPKVRFPHEKDIVYKVFGAGNLDGWEYDEAKALVALAKEELLKDIKPKVSEGLEEEMDKYYSQLPTDAITHLSVNIYQLIARHFAKWGAEHRGSSEIPKDLEEAAEELAEEHGFVKEPNFKPAKYSWSAVRDVFIEGVIAGAKWQREQMMKEAVEGYISATNEVSAVLALPKGDFKKGDKVNLLFVKEDEK